MARWKNTTYQETVKEPASPRTTLSQEVTQIERTVLVDWDAQETAALDFLGYPEIKLLPNGIQSYLKRNIPIYDPQWLDQFGLPTVWCTKVSIEPLGVPPESADGTTIGVQTQDFGPGPFGLQNPSFARYEQAKMTLHMETLSYDILPDNKVTQTAGGPDESFLQRYVTIRPKPNVQYLTLPPGSFRYVIAGTPAVPGSPGKLECSYDLSITWHAIPTAVVGSQIFNPSMSYPAIDLTMGRVNSDALAGCRPGTLLLVAVDLTPFKHWSLRRLWDVNYHFKFLDPPPAAGTIHGHNLLYCVKRIAPAVNGYVEITIDGTTAAIASVGQHIYDGKPFAPLFQVNG